MTRKGVHRFNSWLFFHLIAAITWYVWEVHHFHNVYDELQAQSKPQRLVWNNENIGDVEKSSIFDLTTIFVIYQIFFGLGVVATLIWLWFLYQSKRIRYFRSSSDKEISVWCVYHLLMTALGCFLLLAGLTKTQYWLSDGWSYPGNNLSESGLSIDCQPNQLQILKSFEGQSYQTGCDYAWLPKHNVTKNLCCGTFIEKAPSWDSSLYLKTGGLFLGSFALFQIIFGLIGHRLRLLMEPRYNLDASVIGYGNT